MTLNRRTLVLGALGAAFRPSAPAAETAKPTIERFKAAVIPELLLHNVNTDERMFTAFWRDGAYQERELQRIDWFMRDWREGKSRPMDRDLLWGLAAVREVAMLEGHDGDIRFLSGYRTPKTNDMLVRTGQGAVRNSLHIQARAIDFSLPGVTTEAISDFALMLGMGGVGNYTGRFVHIDTGGIRIWTG